MSKQVTVLSDGYFSENQVKALLIEEDNNDAKVVLIDLGNVQKLETEVESLVGEIANLWPKSVWPRACTLISIFV